jgi:hypothetical protein
MAVSWKELTERLEAETERLSGECPDEIKRFHYGLITHSDAGKYSYNQYLGHFVHLYGFYFAESDFILPSILRFAGKPIYSLECLKDMLRTMTPTELGYAGQNQMGALAKEVHQALDGVETREQFLQLVKAWSAYVSRRYWWLHWYFPWGAGPAISPRISPEDVKEMARLLETA